MRIYHITLKRNTEISIVGKLKVFILFLLALYSMQPYFFWDKSMFLYAFSAALILICVIEFCFHSSYSRNVNEKVVFSFLLYLLFFIWWHIYFKGFVVKTVNIFGLVGPIVFTLPPITIFIFSTRDEKTYFLNIFTMFMSLICFISLAFFLLYLVGIKLPNHKIYHPTSQFYKYFDNYLFFIIVRNGTFVIFPRFQSIFTEPGHLGMMCALLLYANQYDVKKISTIILLISVLLSLSLAAYVLLIAGFLIFKFCSSRKKLKMTVFLVTVLALLVIGGVTYYQTHPESVFSQRILSRLLFDEEKGIAGNNRNTAEFKKLYNDFRSNDIQLIFGSGHSVGEVFPKGGNSSYKNFIYEHGLFGLLLLLLFYYSFVNRNFVMLGMLVLWELSFIQRPYAVWESQMFIFISFSALLTKSNNINALQKRG